MNNAPPILRPYRIRPGIRPRIIGGLVVAFVYVNWYTAIVGQDSKTRTPSTQSSAWSIPSLERVRAELEAWFDQSLADHSRQTEMRAWLATRTDLEMDANRLDFVLAAIGKSKPELQAIIDWTKQPVETVPVGLRGTLELVGEDTFARNHLDLALMRWMVKHRLYDEALDQVADLRAELVLDPAALLFLRATAHHQLAHSLECQRDCRELLRNEAELPRRFSSLARMMLADIEPFQPETLDEISRLMNDVERRQSLFRSGRQVRDQEQLVLKKLDELIERAEQAAQSMAQPESGGAPATPLPDSQGAPGLGAGDAAKRSLPGGGNWGNLPPSERAAAIAELTQDLPPHYRAVIEEYFRVLAQEERSDR